jgi:hypothetical protein
MFDWFKPKTLTLTSKQEPVDPMLAVMEAAQAAIEEKRAYEAKASNPNFPYSNEELDFAKQVVDASMLQLPAVIKKDYLKNKHNYVLMEHKEWNGNVHTKCSGKNDPVFKEAQRRLAEIGLTCSIADYCSHDYLIQVNIPMDWTPNQKPVLCTGS